MDIHRHIFLLSGFENTFFFISSTFFPVSCNYNNDMTYKWPNSSFFNFQENANQENCRQYSSIIFSIDKFGNKEPDEQKIYGWTEFFTSWTITSEKKRERRGRGFKSRSRQFLEFHLCSIISFFHWFQFICVMYIIMYMLRIYIYNLHGLSCQEKVSRFSMLVIPRYGTSLAVSHWKLRMVLMVEYRSSRLDQNKPFSGPVSTLLSSSADFTVSAETSPLIQSEKNGSLVAIIS